MSIEDNFHQKCSFCNTHLRNNIWRYTNDDCNVLLCENCFDIIEPPQYPVMMHCFCCNQEHKISSHDYNQDLHLENILSN